MTTDRRNPARPGDAAADSSKPDRRSSGMLRIPFVRRSRLEFDDGTVCDAFIVNINILGAYVALDHLPEMGQRVSCHFKAPGNEREIVADGIVAWLNPRQAHPVHSLPPGFGIKFENLAETDRHRVENLVNDYIHKHTVGHGHGHSHR